MTARSGKAWESRQGAYPVVRRGIVVGIAVAVDIARVGRRPAHDGAQPPIDAMISKGQRATILPLPNELHARASALYQLYVALYALRYRFEPRDLHRKVHSHKALQVLV